LKVQLGFVDDVGGELEGLLKSPHPDGSRGRDNSGASPFQTTALLSINTEPFDEHPTSVRNYFSVPLYGIWTSTYFDAAIVLGPLLYQCICGYFSPGNRNSRLQYKAGY
jgi:hypothetical protein